jgi:two-component system C4-dicarboxylate transport response regulator DctD
MTQREGAGPAWDREEADPVRERPKRLVPWTPNPTILLVEDDDEMRRSLADLLRRDGYRVVEAADADDALEWLGAGSLEAEPGRVPALIISDICLPVLSGLDLSEGAQLCPRPLPVILIAGFGDDECRARGRALGADCVLDEPFSMETLRSAVRFALGRRSPDPWERDGHVV